MIKTITGIIIGVLFSGLLIYSISEGYSLMQVFAGFILFIFPAIFLSSFKSRTASFILTFVATLFIYICFKYNYTNTWAGVAMALTLGLPLYYLKVRNTR